MEENKNTSEEIMAGHTVSVHDEEKSKPEGEKVDSKRGENLEEKENKEKKIWNDKFETDARGI